LQGYGKQFHFQYDQSSSSIGTVSYSISNAINIAQVWDVTDIFNASKIENSQQHSFFKANLGELRKYIALDPSDYYTTKFPNQNFKSKPKRNLVGQDSFKISIMRSLHLLF
jgi:hypothetical protein